MSEQVVENLIRSAAVLIGAGLFYWLAVVVGHRLEGKVAARGKEQAERAHTLWLVIRRIILIVLAVSVVLLIMSVWGFSIAPLLGLGAVMGAAIGFGAQDLVKDIIAGFFILAEDQFRVGDVVTIAGATGSVEDIQLRVTVLRDLEGNQHFVPNGQITVASNYTAEFAYPVIDVGISYESDVDRGLLVLKDELNSLVTDPEWSDRIHGEVEILGVNSLDDSAVVLRARLTTEAEDRWSVRREAFRRLKKRFDAEGITIPFPQITVSYLDRSPPTDQRAD